MHKTELRKVLLTPDVVGNWLKPPIQRPFTNNAKVREVSDQIRSELEFPGIIHIGVLNDVLYLVDAQHRLEAWSMAGSPPIRADVRFVHFSSMGEIGEEFFRVNQHLVNIRPDDKLRALELTLPVLLEIRRHCPFVGYDHIRRNGSSPIISMSKLLRNWMASSAETPVSGGSASVHVAAQLQAASAKDLIDFLRLAHAAWGRDPEYARLWAGLNLTMCMWLYRNMVLDTYTERTTELTKQQFGRALSTLSSNGAYLDWLVSRNLSDHSRSPAYTRMKKVMLPRLREDLGTSRIYFPDPPWVS